MTKKVAVILSGCGVFDGSEIYESVITLLSLDKAGAEVQCFAPNIPQMHVINHLTGEVAEGESRNVLVEAARLVRGEIKALSEAQVEDFDAVKDAVDKAEIKYQMAEITMLPQNMTAVEGKEAEQVIRFMDALDDCDDIQKFYINADIPDEAFDAM